MRAFNLVIKRSLFFLLWLAAGRKVRRAESYWKRKRTPSGPREGI